MITPTIHLNGTSRADLASYLSDACMAIIRAERALEEAAPHGRDYYPQGNDAITIALSEHRDRVARLVSVRHELEMIAEVIIG